MGAFGCHITSCIIIGAFLRCRVKLKPLHSVALHPAVFEHKSTSSLSTYSVVPVLVKHDLVKRAAFSSVRVREHD